MVMSKSPAGQRGQNRTLAQSAVICHLGLKASVEAQARVTDREPQIKDFIQRKPEHA